MILPNNNTIAYFSMEIGINSKIPTYSGGLGILAGDTLKTAADMKLPLVGVTLLSKHGYFFQKLNDGIQEEIPVQWRVDDFLEQVDTTVIVNIENRDVKVGCWLYKIEGCNGDQVPVVFLHTDFAENDLADRDITDHLYGTGTEYRLKQEIVLAVGGLRMLKALGFDNLKKVHLNEGHSAFISLELLKEVGDPAKAKEMCVFTTHTIVPSGHDEFDIESIERNLEPGLFELLGEKYKIQGRLNMTELALDNSKYINAVANKHTEVSKEMFPNYSIYSITNGVHAETWVSPHFAEVYDEFVPNWKNDPASLSSAISIPDEKIWQAHVNGKKQIIDFANAYSNAGLDYDYFTIGWARRITSYKRPEFILENIERLEEIAKKNGPIQIIYAGKAHAQDIEGKTIIKEINDLSKSLKGDVNLVYLANYDMYVSKFLTSGVDLWLNTPVPPQEASGTSGMKCALNGIPQASVLDGWWLEGYAEGKTGWAFNSPDDFYNLLDEQILPFFYRNREKWQEMMKQTIMLNGSYFNSHRMLGEYAKYAYKIFEE